MVRLGKRGRINVKPLASESHAMPRCRSSRAPRCEQCHVKTLYSPIFAHRMSFTRQRSDALPLAYPKHAYLAKEPRASLNAVARKPKHFNFERHVTFGPSLSFSSL